MQNVNKNQLRRLRILQTLQTADGHPVGEAVLLDRLRVDPQLEPTIELVRKSIYWLEENDLVNIIQADDSPWLAARIQFPGVNFLDGTDPGIVGIYQPSEFPKHQLKTGGRNSSVNLLPSAVKAWLDQALVTNNFSQYDLLESEMKSRGFDISRSALGRYGLKYKKQLSELKAKIEMAKGFAEAMGDDGAAMNQGMIAMAQATVMDVIQSGEFDKDEKLSALVNAVARLSRADINNKKYLIEQNARKQALAEAAGLVESEGAAQGMGPEQLKFWKEKFLGLK